MALEDFTGELIVPLRDEIRDRWLRDYKLRVEEASIGPGTLPYARASTIADTVSPIHANAVTIGKNVASSTKSGTALDADLVRAGTYRLPPVGASGFVAITASAGGTTIFEDDELRRGEVRYRCTKTQLYHDGNPVPVQGIDTGPETNVDAGQVLEWRSPRPGCGSRAVVLAKHDGSGLSGGRLQESDDEANKRLAGMRARPSASGNEAEYIRAINETPGVPVEQGFVMPGIKGPGTKAFVFTVRPDRPGGSRIPDGVQIARVLSHVKGKFPGDDGIFAGTIVPQPLVVALRVAWASNVPGWVDATPWPLYGSPMVTISAVTSTTTFVVADSPVAPQPGQTFALFDRPARAFRNKRVLSATPLGGNSYSIVCDTTNNASDTTFAPMVGDPVCPWSDTLAILVDPVVTYFDRVGPGQQVSDFFDPGLRQHRVPLDGEDWPSTVTTRLLSPLRNRRPSDPAGLFDLPHLASVSMLLPADPTAPSVGLPGVSSNMLTLGRLVAFP